MERLFLQTEINKVQRSMNYPSPPSSPSSFSHHCPAAGKETLRLRLCPHSRSDCGARGRGSRGPGQQAAGAATGKAGGGGAPGAGPPPPPPPPGYVGRQAGTAGCLAEPAAVGGPGRRVQCRADTVVLGRPGLPGKQPVCWERGADETSGVGVCCNPASRAAEMNALTQIRNQQRATAREVGAGLGEGASWHAQFRARRTFTRAVSRSSSRRATCWRFSRSTARWWT